MKNYLANKSFSRGVETLGAEATLTERADRCWAALRWGDTAAAI